MSAVFALVYPDIAQASQVMDRINDDEIAYRADVLDAVLVTKDADGRLKLHQTHHTTGSEAMWGLFWGMLLGFLFIVPLFGMTAGAAIGAALGHFIDHGIDDRWIEDVTEEMAPGGAVVFALVSDQTAEAFRASVTDLGGTILTASLSRAAEEHLQAAIAAGTSATNPSQA
jgi:uncharacterized membrane protein